MSGDGKIRGVFSIEERDFLFKNYPLLGGKECAILLNRTEDSVYHFVSKHGISVTDDAKSLIFKKARVKNDEDYPINTKLFRNIDSSEMAYMLGYIWADGYVRIFNDNTYRLHMEINSDDARAIKPIFDKLGKWRYSDACRKIGKPLTRISISNKEAVKILSALDFERKSHVSPCKVVAQIPVDLRHHFWLGFLDGDGCITFGQWHQEISFSGTYHQPWTALENQLKELKIDYKIKRIIRSNGHKHSRLYICQLDSVYRFGKYLYQSYDQDKIGLYRKYAKWLPSKIKKERYIYLDQITIDWNNTELTKDNVYSIVKRYNGLIGYNKILQFFRCQERPLKNLLQEMREQKIIKSSGKGPKSLYNI